MEPEKNDELDAEKVKAHLKRTREANVQSVDTPPDGCACAPPCESSEFKLEDSAELTPDKVRAALQKTAAEAKAHTASAQQIASRPPTAKRPKR